MSFPNGHTRYNEYTWRLCPFSEEYQEEYFDNCVMGPSSHWRIIDPNYFAGGLPHSTTNGRMKYRHSGVPGWICLDTNCKYYVEGEPLHEVFGHPELYRAAIPPGTFYFES